MEMVYGILDKAFGALFESEAKEAAEDTYQYADHDFIVHGFYGVSNFGGYEVQLSDCGDMARLRDSETLEVSEWAEIIEEDTGDGDSKASDIEWVIPLWGGVPLNMVMRV